jgi:hypothetical protein
MTQSGPTPCLPRQQTDGCDSEGNLINQSQQIRVYDAANNQVKFEDWRHPVGESPNHPGNDLLAHKVRHVLQYRWYGKFNMSVDYLWESAKLGAADLYLGGPSLASHLGYYGNEYEEDARSTESGVEHTIKLLGNPCR